MPDNAFGLPDDVPPDMEDPFADSPVVGEEEAEEPAAETETEPVPVEEGEPEPETEVAEAEIVAEPEDEVPEVETVEEAEERLFAGKYKSAEELEKGYSELSTRQREIAAENQQLTEYLRVAAQVLQEKMQEQPPEKREPLQEELQELAEQYGTDVETIRVARAMAEQQAQEAVTPLQQQIQQQAQQQAEAAEAFRKQQETLQVITGFKNTVELDDATETQMVEVFNELQLDESDPEMYPVAHEAAQSAELRQVLNAMPDLVTTEAGMNMARQLAAGNSPTQTRTARNTPAARQRAHVEAGGSGAAASATEKPKEVWDVLELAKKDRAEESVFGV